MIEGAAAAFLFLVPQFLQTPLLNEIPLWQLLNPINHFGDATAANTHPTPMGILISRIFKRIEDGWGLRQLVFGDGARRIYHLNNEHHKIL